MNEYTDEEVERAYEEFYEDVHTEFLKFGEIVNFKVCRNGSTHLRGNVYVHYKSLDSAVLSYQSVNGRYFAGKQLHCEFVGVTRWKVAICGEFMKSRLQTCSRGMSCNFIHCFRNPGGDYEWADWDKPPPKYWLKKMAALFGYSDELAHDKKIERRSPRLFRNSRRTLTDDADRSQSRENDCSRSSRNYTEDDVRTGEPWQRHRSADRKHSEDLNDEQCGYSSNSREKRHRYASIDRESDRNWLERIGGRHSSYGSSNPSPDCRKGKLGSRGGKSNEMNVHENDPDENMDKFYHHGHSRRSTRHREKSIHRREESPKSDGSEEFEHKSSKRQCTRKLKISTIRDHLGRGSGEGEHDSESPCSSGRSYRNSESKYHSQTDRYKLERGEPEKQFHDHLKKSERKRGTSRIQCHDAMKSLATENLIEEATDERGRWEPEKGGDLSE